MLQIFVWIRSNFLYIKKNPLNEILNWDREVKNLNKFFLSLGILPVLFCLLKGYWLIISIFLGFFFH